MYFGLNQFGNASSEFTMGPVLKLFALSDSVIAVYGDVRYRDHNILNCCHVLWGHKTPIFCVGMNSDLDVVVSSSQVELVCFHMVRRGEFIRSFCPAGLAQKSQPQ